MNKITNEVLNNWKNEIGALNVEKGWRTEQRTIEDHCALLHSEVSEAFEDYRNNHAINEVWYEYPGKKIYNDKKRKICVDLNFNESIEMLGKPCGIPSELSDVVIRALDMADEFEWEIDYDDYDLGKKVSFPYLINLLHDNISELSAFKSRYELQFLIGVIIYICNENEVDLYQEIEDKIEYNRTRPARHGGKRL